MRDGINRVFFPTQESFPVMMGYDLCLFVSVGSFARAIHCPALSPTRRARAGFLVPSRGHDK